MNRPLMTIYDIQAVDPATPRRLLDLAFKHKLIAPAVQMGDHHYYTAPLSIDHLMAFAAEVAASGVNTSGEPSKENGNG